MSGEATLLLAQAVATLGMVGVIWFVQVIHYPLMGQVGAAEFAGYEAANVRRTAWVVVPLMVTEAVSALALCLMPGSLPRAEALVGLALLAGVWASTFLLQVPLHDRLGRGFDATAHQALVRTNWLRTLLWSARGALVLAWIGQALA